MKAPEPHPLDYDWRFTPTTAGQLADEMAVYKSCLCVGVPTVASLLESRGAKVLLIERQPLQSVRAQIVADPSTDPPITASFPIALVDPPWYSDIYRRWLAWTAAQLDESGEILASLWLPDTRPTAKEEREEALAWITSWAQVEFEPFDLIYTTPPFEVSAMVAGGTKTIDQHWRRGSLIHIRPYVTPPLPAPIAPVDNWARFIFDDYQLALRLRDDENSSARLLRVPGAKEWVWPSVSRRARGRERIDLWSSRNEVAVVEGGYEVLRDLRSIILTNGLALRHPQSEVLQTLSHWQIPVGPYWRTLEWTHRA